MPTDSFIAELTTETPGKSVRQFYRLVDLRWKQMIQRRVAAKQSIDCLLDGRRKFKFGSLDGLRRRKIK